jgi:two-component system, OmpR family, sensor histidine kinase KdpD
VTLPADVRQLLLGIASIAVVAGVFTLWPQASSPATVALSLLVVVLLVAAAARLWVAVTTSVAAMLAFNFFFLPPVGTLTIADPENWAALIAFLAVSLVASNLSTIARARTREAVARRDELGRLFDLSRDVLLITGSREANASLASYVSRRFDLDYVAICVPDGREWIVFEAKTQELGLDPQDLAAALPTPERTTGSGEEAWLDDGHRTVSVGPHAVRLLHLRLGARPIGLLAVAGRNIEAGTLDAVAGLVAIAIERAQFLDERKMAELARQSEELKSALLASLGHDLRTPLTAIRVAASNLQAAWPDEQQRQEQSDLILTEVDQLTRLFQNVLEMARVDAGAVTQDMRWVAPSEIFDAARSRVEHALRGRAVDLSGESERLVHLDPRLTAGALSYLLENAAQYAPSGSPIDVTASVADDGLTIGVRDHGPGIAASDLPHVFERFYRGVNAKQRRSGTGMGLAIARGLLAVARGRIAAENCADGGARFTMVVPAEVR